MLQSIWFPRLSNLPFSGTLLDSPNIWRNYSVLRIFSNKTIFSYKLRVLQWVPPLSQLQKLWSWMRYDALIFVVSGTETLLTSLKSFGNLQENTKFTIEINTNNHVFKMLLCLFPSTPNSKTFFNTWVMKLIE